MKLRVPLMVKQICEGYVVALASFMVLYFLHPADLGEAGRVLLGIVGIVYGFFRPDSGLFYPVGLCCAVTSLVLVDMLRGNHQAYLGFSYMQYWLGPTLIGTAFGWAVRISIILVRRAIHGIRFRRS